MCVNCTFYPCSFYVRQGYFSPGKATKSFIFQLPKSLRCQVQLVLNFRICLFGPLSTHYTNIGLLKRKYVKFLVHLTFNGESTANQPRVVSCSVFNLLLSVQSEGYKPLHNLGTRTHLNPEINLGTRTHLNPDTFYDFCVLNSIK